MTMTAEWQPKRDLIACPKCDAVYQLSKPEPGQTASCARCGHVLITPRRKAGLQIIALSLAILILILAAAVFPFLAVNSGGVSNSVSIIDAALAFQDGPLIVLSLTMVALILFIPMVRVFLSLYVLIPLVADRAPARHSAHAFRLSEALRPWSMVEIFAIGCAVAVIKISDLATVDFGPAFWMFAILVILVVVQDSFVCRWSVWNALSEKTK